MVHIMSVALIGIMLALAPIAGSADGYPEQVTIGVGPSSRDWLALFTLEGRWAVQVGDGCPWIASGMGMNVLLTAPVDDDTATLVVPDSAEFGAGESCPITGHVWQTAAPCGTNPDGVCDVAYDQ